MARKVPTPRLHLAKKVNLAYLGSIRRTPKNFGFVVIVDIILHQIEDMAHQADVSPDLIWQICSR